MQVQGPAWVFPASYNLLAHGEAHRACMRLAGELEDRSTGWRRLQVRRNLDVDEG
jgi:hypothetical protein